MRLLLPVIAILGLLVPGGLFLYWLFHDVGLGAALQTGLHDRLALAVIIDVVVTTGVLAAYFAKYPAGEGRWRWPWFVVFSVCGTLVFGLALYWWLNKRPTCPIAQRDTAAAT